MAKGISNRDALDWLTNEKRSQEKVRKELGFIHLGAGWATDNYILNFMDHLTQKEQLSLMIKLAQEGLLYDEEGLSEKDLLSSSKPKTGKVTVKWVVTMYKYLNK